MKIEDIERGLGIAAGIAAIISAAIMCQQLVTTITASEANPIPCVQTSSNLFLFTFDNSGIA